MKKIVLFLVVVSVFCSLKIHSQNGFRFKNVKNKKQRISFTLVNNLIVIPVEINGKKLSFILDSGVSKTILFNIAKNDSVGLKNVEVLKLKGLGNGEPLQALLSKKNKVSVNKLVSTDEEVYVVLEDKFDLSARMGVTIHGILGYNLLRNYIVKINYKTKKIDFFNPKKFNYKKCKKCEVFPIRFYRKKPYINAQVQLDTIGTTLTDVKLLIDSGGSDAIWLFEGTKKNIKTPKRFFKDVLGEGLSGSIIGNRSRIPKIKLKSFEIENPTTSFLNEVSTKNARKFKARNGSLGAGILKRFTVWFDYPNRKLTLKKNSEFNKKFNYNMSGLYIVYDGKQLVKEKTTKRYVAKDNNQALNTNTSNSINYITNYRFKFKSSYKIKTVLINSPAAKAGIKAGDVIVKLNNNYVYKYSLNEIVEKLQEKENKLIKMVLERDGKKIKIQFKLKKRI